MFNVIIFLLGAGIMFFMALRSVLARRRLCTQGQKVTATVEGTVKSRDGGAYVLAFTTAGGSHRLHYPKPARGKSFAVGDPSPYTMTPTPRRRCTWKATGPHWEPRCCMPCWVWSCWC